MTTTGHYTMLYQVAYPEDISGDDITVVGSEPNTVYITVDRLTSRKVEVKGSFSGTTAEGYMADDMLGFGPMTVKVTIAEGRIAAVKIVENHETQTIAGAALESVPDAIMAENNATVAVVSGATMTSNRIMNAVAECLEQAAK